jgi:tetratricopeptide (TPR) repeat protein
MKTILYYNFILAILISCSSTATHTYKLKVIDKDGKPIQGAEINYQYKYQHMVSYEKTLKVDTDSSDNQGIFLTELDIPKREGDQIWDVYFSKFLYRINKDGYYPSQDELSSIYGSSDDYIKFTKIAHKEIVEAICYLKNIYHVYQVNVFVPVNIDLKEVLIKYKLFQHGKEVSLKETHANYILDSVEAAPVYIDNKHKINTAIEYYITAPYCKPILITHENDFGSYLPSNMKSKYTWSDTLKEFYHKYKIYVADKDNKPLKNAIVEYSLSNGMNIAGPFSRTTDKDGFVLDSIAPRFKEWSINSLESPTEIKYTITKFGYDTVFGSLKSTYGEVGSIDNEIKECNAELTRKSDDELAKIKWGRKFRNRYFETLPPDSDVIINIFMIESGDENETEDERKFATQESARFLSEYLEIKPDFEKYLINYLKNDLNSTITFSNVYNRYLSARPESPWAILLNAALSLKNSYFSEVENPKELREEIYDDIKTANKLFNNQNPFALVKLSEVCSTLEKYPEGIWYAKKAIELEPNYANAYYALGKNQAGKGEIDDAIESYKLALDNFKTSDYENDKRRCLIGLVDAFMVSENFSDGIITLTQYSSLFENKDLINYYRGYFNYRNGDNKKAREYLLKVLKSKEIENKSGLYVILGHIEMRLNNYSTALSYFAQAEKLDPELGDIYYYRALIYYQQNNCKKAKEQIDIASYKYDGSTYKIEEQIKKKCSPEEYVYGYVSRYWYCYNGYNYDEACVYKVEITWTNNSNKRITKITFDLEISEDNYTKYKDKYWMKVSLDPGDKLTYTLILHNSVYTNDKEDAGDLDYSITIIKVE